MSKDFVTAAELAQAMPHVLAAPKTDAAIDSLCFRPGFNQRQFPDSLPLTVHEGVPGERWLAQPWLKLPDGSPDPAIQVSILPTRVMDLVWRDRQAAPHPGDTIVADLDCSEENLPEGILIQAGTAVLRASSVFNDGCVKWKVRYGQAAKDWIVAPGHSALRLRGVLCSIVKDGEIRLTDRLHVLR
jgi:hypothetical protein